MREGKKWEGGKERGGRGHGREGGKEKAGKGKKELGGGGERPCDVGEERRSCNVYRLSSISFSNKNGVAKYVAKALVRSDADIEEKILATSFSQEPQ